MDKAILYVFYYNFILIQDVANNNAEICATLVFILIENVFCNISKNDCNKISTLSIYNIIFLMAIWPSIE